MALKRKDVRALFENTDTSTEEKVAKLMAMHIETVDGIEIEDGNVKDKDAVTKTASERYAEKTYLLRGRIQNIKILDHSGFGCL